MTRKFAGLGETIFGVDTARTGLQALTRVAALLLFGGKEKISPKDIGGSFAER
jgi:hypothetical protein